MNKLLIIVLLLSFSTLVHAQVPKPKGSEWFDARATSGGSLIYNGIERSITYHIYNPTDKTVILKADTNPGAYSAAISPKSTARLSLEKAVTVKLHTNNGTADVKWYIVKSNSTQSDN